MRKRPTPKQRAAVFAFYGIWCVVRGPKNENELDLAHIDDDNTNTVFENLLPLSKDLNGACNDSKNQKKPDLPEELYPNQLAIRAWTHFRNAHFAASYGCYRLSAQIALTRFDDISRALDCLCSCIAAVRPLADERLLRHVILLTPSVIEASSERIHPFWKGEFLSQLGLVLYDYQYPDMARVCQEKAQAFYAKSVDAPFKRDSELREAAAMRRYALVQYNNKTLDMLDELVATFRKRGDYTGEATTWHVRAILELEEKGSINDARDSLEAMLQLEPKTRNPWVVAELHLLLGRIYVALREREKAIEGDGRGQVCNLQLGRGQGEIGGEAGGHIFDSLVFGVRERREFRGFLTRFGVGSGFD